MKAPSISIVLPSYNKVDYIGKTIESIVTQRYSNFELIVQDGGSTDGTLEIIKRYAKIYPKLISWESRKDKGQVDAINKGLKKAKGNILTYINADDYYHKFAFKLVAKSFTKNPNQMWFVGEGTAVNDSDKEVSTLVTKYKNSLLGLNKRFLLLTVNYMFQPSVFITKEAYKMFGPFKGVDGIVMEYDLWLRLSSQGMPTVIKRPISFFRLSESGFSSNRYRTILAMDQKIVGKFTSNPLILGLHYIHNYLRVLTIKMIKFNA